MAGLRFLERLRAMSRNPDVRTADPVQDVLHSVIRHVSSILNTRQGSSQLDDDMGVPDFTSMGVVFTATDVPDIERRLTTLISRYEPRLAEVEVHLTPETDVRMIQMNFSLQARLIIGKNDTLPVRLFTRFTSDGRVVVES